MSLTTYTLLHLTCSTTTHVYEAELSQRNRATTTSIVNCLNYRCGTIKRSKRHRSLVGDSCIGLRTLRYGQVHQSLSGGGVFVKYIRLLRETNPLITQSRVKTI